MNNGKENRYADIKRDQLKYFELKRNGESNQFLRIHFDTLEKLCNVLECEPGDILVLKKRKEKLKK